MVTELSKQDRDWLLALDKALHKPEPARTSGGFQGCIKMEANRELTIEECDRFFTLIETHGLVCQIFCTSMFGGLGLQLYEHEVYPGTGPRPLCSIIEAMLPEGMLTKEERADSRRKMMGTAWVLFSKYAKTTQNKEWLKRYKLRQDEAKADYDY